MDDLKTTNENHREQVLYKLRKQRWMIPFMVVFCPVWLFIGLIFIVPCFTNILSNRIDFDAQVMYVFSVICLFLFVPLAIMLPISYFKNSITLTNRRVLIQKGTMGRKIEINLSSIRAFQHVKIKTKKITSVYLYFFLKTGYKVKTGNLSIRKGDRQLLLEHLRQYIPQVNTKQEIDGLEASFAQPDEIEEIFNPLLAIVSWFPIVLGMVMLLLYISGFNQVGGNNIEITGIVEDKYIYYLNGDEISSYALFVSDENTGQEYEVPVEDAAYESFQEDDNIKIEAIKGSLGILYDIELSK